MDFVSLRKEGIVTKKEKKGHVKVKCTGGVRG